MKAISTPVLGIRALVANLHRGIQKSRSYLVVQGPRKTLKMIRHFTLSMQLYYRIEIEPGSDQSHIVPSIPINIRIISGEFAFSEEAQAKITSLRGSYGVLQFHERLARGDILFAAYHENSLAGFGWLQFAPAVEAGYRLPENTVYTYDAWVFDEFRGNRVFPAIKQEYSNYLREHHPEVERVLAHVATWNRSIIRADQAAGAYISGVDLAIIFLGYNRRFKIG